MLLLDTPKLTLRSGNIRSSSIPKTLRRRDNMTGSVTSSLTSANAKPSVKTIASARCNNPALRRLNAAMPETGFAATKIYHRKNNAARSKMIGNFGDYRLRSNTGF